MSTSRTSPSGVPGSAPHSSSISARATRCPAASRIGAIGLAAFFTLRPLARFALRIEVDSTSIYSVVFGVRANELDKRCLAPKIECHDGPIGITPHTEHNALDFRRQAAFIKFVG